MGKKRGPKNRTIDPQSKRTQQMAESVIRSNSPIRQAYDRYQCQPPIGAFQGKPAIEVAGHVIARVQQIAGGNAVPELEPIATSFRDNAIAVRIIDMAS